MSLDVIGAGFGRTGTLSLKLALEELELGPCYHMAEVRLNPHHVALWTRAASGEKVDWDALLASYRCGVDWPVARFWRQLYEQNPDARVIWTCREPEVWYESLMESVYPASFRFRDSFRENNRRVWDMVNAVIWEGVFEGRIENKQFALSKFAAEEQLVKDIVQPEQLLLYRVGDGWGPLCEFLNVSVPEVPFPHVNLRGEYAVAASEGR